MFDTRKNKVATVICLSLLFILYSAGVFYAGMYYQQMLTLRQETVPTQTRFIVKEYNNMITVFEEGSDIPQKVLNIDVETLRKQDRLRFQEGITVDSPGELIQLEEDFSS
ncbi:MAG: hypothetical protein BWY15_00105 [Firmicutes bacterium ADurb.Bin193]|nr:MAG: hypothetical protein BWY15_00105 [Firmicutes bacterium ADurb.Bin193]